jgi:hypothetical protein
VSDVSYKDLTWEQVLALEDEYSPTIGVPTGLLDLRDLRDFLGRKKAAELKQAHVARLENRRKVYWSKLVAKKPKTLRGRRIRRVRRRTPKP